MRLLLFVIAVLFSFNVQPPSVLADAAATSQDEAFVTGSIVAEGMGLPPVDDTLTDTQKRALSLRAARVMALRAVVEAIDGVMISGTTTVQNASVTSEVVTVSVKSFVQGAEVISEQYDEATGMATVSLRVALTGSTGIAAALLPEVAGLGDKLPFYAPAVKVNGGAGFDGVIVDVRGTDFRPAILNRLVTVDAAVLFDPSMVKAGPMEQVTTVGYTDSLVNAVELLFKTGSKNPVTITPASITGLTDVVVKKADSRLLYGANTATGLFKRGRVVFVLGNR